MVPVRATCTALHGFGHLLYIVSSRVFDSCAPGPQPSNLPTHGAISCTSPAGRWSSSGGRVEG